MNAGYLNAWTGMALKSRNISIFVAEDDDLLLIRDAHRASILELASRFYPQDVVSYWGSERDLEEYREAIARQKNRPLRSGSSFMGTRSAKNLKLVLGRLNFPSSSWPCSRMYKRVIPYNSILCKTGKLRKLELIFALNPLIYNNNCHFDWSVAERRNLRFCPGSLGCARDDR